MYEQAATDLQLKPFVLVRDCIAVVAMDWFTSSSNGTGEELCAKTLTQQPTRFEVSGIASDKKLMCKTWELWRSFFSIKES